MSEKFILEVITPERVVLREEVHEVTAPGAQGEFGVLPGHAHFMTTLGVGPLRYQTGSASGLMAVAGGFAEIGPGKVLILAETAELPQEIDRERAERARERALQGMKGLAAEDRRFIEMEAALKRAVNRLRISGH